MPLDSGKGSTISLGMIQAHSSSTGHRNSGNSHQLLNRPNHVDQPCPMPPPSTKDRYTVSSRTSVTGSDEEGRDGSGSDTATADQKDAEDEEEDGVAPSDSAIILDDHQAGHTREENADSLTAVGQKRRHSLSPEEEAPPATKIKTAKCDREIQERQEMSDDDDYTGVDLISDSDEVDLSAEHLEESLVIASQGVMLDDRNAQWMDSSHNWGSFDCDGSLFLTNTPYFAEQYSLSDPIALANEAGFETPTSVVDENTALSRTSNKRRRVRFADPVSPLGEAFDDRLSKLSQQDPSAACDRENEEPATRRGKIAKSDSNPKPSQKDRCMVPAESTQWHTPQMPSNSIDRDPEDCESWSGYETDLGETTDEIPPCRTQAPWCRPLESSVRHERSQTSITLHRPSPKGQRQGPLMATWVANPNKPFALADKTGRVVFHFPKIRGAEKPKKTLKVTSGSSTAITGPPLSFSSISLDFGFSAESGALDPSDFSSQEQLAHHVRLDNSNGIRPLLLHRDSGLTACRDRLADFNMLPPSLILPFLDLDTDLLLDECKRFNMDQDEDEDDVPLNMEDYIDFSDDSEESENDEECLAVMTGNESPSSSAQAPSTQSDARPAQNWLDDLGKGMVNAFRRDQHRHATLKLDEKNPDSLKFMREDTLGDCARASLSPQIGPLKKRRMNDGPSHTESINLARAALAIS